ncbi:MAG: HAMP domain-containing histidine kinase, partial [Anaerolineae bacterium]|nr:HAMP domain-containing histidine kinase [Anaerolineae bacterium]
MDDILSILEGYGEEQHLPPGMVICHQGSASDGVYYLKSGRLTVYLEEQGELFPLSEVAPQEMVGELGAATGWPRTATIRTEEPSCILHVPAENFKRALIEIPSLAAEIVRQIGERLTAADVARLTLGNSYQQALARAQTLHTEKAQLEEVLRLREELAHTLVHDLRNPLGVISAGLDMLAHPLSQEADTPEQREYLIDLMYRSARRMQYLVDTLLDIARLEEGLELRTQPLKLCDVLNDVIAEERPLADKAQIALENRIAPHLPPVRADAAIVQRVLINLIDNALKFTPSGGRVWVEARADGGEVELAVVDTGPGIPQADRARIFEKFTQVKGR